MKKFGLSQAVRYCHGWLYNELEIASLWWHSEKPLQKFPISNWIIIIEKKSNFCLDVIQRKRHLPSQSRPINFLTKNVEFVFFSFLFDSLMSYSSFIPRPFRALNCLRKMMRKYKWEWKWEWNECRLNRFLPQHFRFVCGSQTKIEQLLIWESERRFEILNVQLKGDYCLKL